MWLSDSPGAPQTLAEAPTVYPIPWRSALAPARTTTTRSMTSSINRATIGGGVGQPAASRPRAPERPGDRDARGLSGPVGRRRHVRRGAGGRDRQADAPASRPLRL